jgi:hypothetical protein
MEAPKQVKPKRMEADERLPGGPVEGGLPDRDHSSSWATWAPITSCTSWARRFRRTKR